MAGMFGYLCCLLIVSSSIERMSVDAANLRTAKNQHSNDVTATEGLCGPTHLCCQGKDNQCRAPLTTSDDDVIDSRQARNNMTCFCDVACADLGDCCSDYKETCKPVDCILADEWDEFGECDTRCGLGIRQRKRQIIQPPLNGGRRCGKTVERIPCEGTNCKVARAPNEEMRETGYIIPAVYGSWRQSKRYDPFSDIRRNLFEHYDAKSRITRPPYCMTFQLTEVRSACNVSSEINSKTSISLDWAHQLVKGHQVCVECQPAVMKKNLGVRCRGQGILNKQTRWDAVTVPGCRGRWVLKSRQEDCQCANNNNISQLDSFILV